MNASANFANAPGQNDFGDLIPDKTIVWGILKIRPYNADQRIVETPSKSSDARYLDCEVTILGGKYNNRKVFTKIGVGGSAKYINMGRSAVKAILEVGKGAGPQNPSAYEIPAVGQDAAGGMIPDWMQLDGAQVAVKLKVEKGKDGYKDKNDVAVWLSPQDPGASIREQFQKLVDSPDKYIEGVAAPAASGGAAPAWGGSAPAAPAAPAWQQPAQAPAQAPAPQQASAAPPPAPPAASTGKPPWID